MRFKICIIDRVNPYCSIIPCQRHDVSHASLIPIACWWTWNTKEKHTMYRTALSEYNGPFSMGAFTAGRQMESETGPCKNAERVWRCCRLHCRLYIPKPRFRPRLSRWHRPINIFLEAGQLRWCFHVRPSPRSVSQSLCETVLFWLASSFGQ